MSDLGLDLATIRAAALEAEAVVYDYAVPDSVSTSVFAVLPLLAEIERLADTDRDLTPSPAGCRTCLGDPAPGYTCYACGRSTSHG